MADQQYKKPVLSAQQMANFLMNHYSSTVPEAERNKYRKASLKLLEETHEPRYAQDVRRLMGAMWLEKNGN